MAIQVPNPWTLQAPYLDMLVNIKDGRGSQMFQEYLTNLDRTIRSMATVSVSQFGGRGDDNSSDSEAFNNAIVTAINLGGGSVLIPSGNFIIDAPVYKRIGDTPIRFVGNGRSSVVKLRGDLPNGAGMFDIHGSNVSFENFVIDGGKTVPTGLQYNADFMGTGGNDPMANSLTRNTSIWIHGGTSGFRISNMLFTHAAGYSVLVDAMDGDISDIEILNNLFRNNRPTAFGVTPGSLIYGSWNGGVFIKGDGRTADSGVVSNVQASGNRFSRNTGNCFWQHLYGLVRLHSNIRAVDNSFEDCGLDGILMGGLTGGIVTSNVFRRVGYMTFTDTDRPTPAWLPNVQATALDSSGIVKGCPYIGNSFLDINGGCLDLDGHADSVIAGNVARVAQVGEPEYTEDDVATSGVSGAGATSYGVNVGNTQNSEFGGKNVSIVGNTFLYLSVGAIRLYAARNCLVEANNIVHPDAPISPPILIGPGGVGANQNATGNVVKHNRIQYDPAAPAPCVFEDPTVAPFVGTDVNFVYGNCPILPSGSLATEFTKNASSGSPTYAETVWFP